MTDRLLSTYGDWDDPEKTTFFAIFADDVGKNCPIVNGNNVAVLPRLKVTRDAGGGVSGFKL